MYNKLMYKKLPLKMTSILDGLQSCGMVLLAWPVFCGTAATVEESFSETLSTPRSDTTGGWEEIDLND